jgi:hypothetical protein
MDVKPSQDQSHADTPMELSNSMGSRSLADAEPEIKTSKPSILEKLNRSVMSSFHGLLAKEPAADLSKLFKVYSETYLTRRQKYIEKEVW